MSAASTQAPNGADVLICVCAFPDADVASRIAHALVEARAAACVNLLPGATSVYRWDGRVETATEVVGLIKTRRDRLDALSALTRGLHPYDVPELVAIEAVGGLPAYLHWVAAETFSADATVAPTAPSAPD